MIGIDTEKDKYVPAHRSRVRAKIVVQMDAESLAREIAEEPLEVRSVVTDVNYDAPAVAPLECHSDEFAQAAEWIRPAHRKVLREEPFGGIAKHHDEPRVGKPLANRTGSPGGPPIVHAPIADRALLAHVP